MAPRANCKPASTCRRSHSCVLRAGEGSIASGARTDVALVFGLEARVMHPTPKGSEFDRSSAPFDLIDTHAPTTSTGSAGGRALGRHRSNTIDRSASKKQASKKSNRLGQPPEARPCQEQRPGPEGPRGPGHGLPRRLGRWWWPAHSRCVCVWADFVIGGSCWRALARSVDGNG